jgi:FkbM family methyltransferase
MKKVYIIVGLYNNMEFLDLAIDDPEMTVFAFEPNPDLIEEIKSTTILPSNYHLVQKAVSNFNGKATFNICSNPTCSSLQDWGNGPTFGDMKKIEVDVVTLKDFIEEKGILEVENIQIDAQGSDLQVLEGIGDKIQTIKRGSCESLAPHVTEWRLYESQPQYSEIEKFLHTHGFSCTWEYNVGNGIPGDEINITFVKQ